MLKTLGNTSSPVASATATGSRIDLDADRGTGAAVSAVVREPVPQHTSGVEWLPRHAPHRRI